MVLLSRDEAYSVRSLIIVAPVTTRIRHIASEVPLGPADGMPQECVANLDTITTIPKDYRQDRIATLSDKKLREGLIQKSFERVKLFSWEKAAKETAQVYRRLME